MEKMSFLAIKGTNAALQAQLIACPWSGNRLMTVEYGTIPALIELKLRSSEKRTTELILGILVQLCCCADGKYEFLGLKCPMIISLIHKFSTSIGFGY
ncbi:hypothetical protein V6N13_080440 [Hibiscus sabdariffa]